MNHIFAISIEKNLKKFFFKIFIFQDGIYEQKLTDVINRFGFHIAENSFFSELNEKGSIRSELYALIKSEDGKELILKNLEETKTYISVATGKFEEIVEAYKKERILFDKNKENYLKEKQKNWRVIAYKEYPSMEEYFSELSKVKHGAIIVHDEKEKNRFMGSTKKWWELWK